MDMDWTLEIEIIKEPVLVLKYSVVSGTIVEIYLRYFTLPDTIVRYCICVTVSTFT